MTGHGITKCQEHHKVVWRCRCPDHSIIHSIPCPGSPCRESNFTLDEPMSDMFNVANVQVVIDETARFCYKEVIIRGMKVEERNDLHLNDLPLVIREIFKVSPTVRYAMTESMDGNSAHYYKEFKFEGAPFSSDK